MARRPQSGAEVAKELMDKMRHKNGGAAKPPDDADELQQEKQDEASAPHVDQGAGAQAAPIADGPTLEERMDAATQDAEDDPPITLYILQGSNPPTPAPAQPKRERMSGDELKRRQRQDRREKRLKERGY